jgi:hypothetical protein
MMLIPQYSLRWILGAMTLLAVVFLFAGQATEGKPWAIGITVAVLTFTTVMLVHVGLFFVVWLFSQVFGRRGQRPPAELAPRSPFAAVEVASVEKSPMPGNA